MIKSVIALLQFATTLPIGMTVDFDQFARRSWLYPVAGYVTGGIAAVIVMLLPLPPLTEAGIALAALLIISGGNHFDGLLDLGDALMAHGSREIRIRALKDRNIGAGGVGAGIMVTLTAFSALASIPDAACVIVIAEVSGKLSMALMTAFGKPFNEGIHSYLHGFSRQWFPALSFLLCLPIFLLPVPATWFAASATATLATVLLILAVSYRLFGGVNGDITGASNEITRAVVFLSVVFFTV